MYKFLFNIMLLSLFLCSCSRYTFENSNTQANWNSDYERCQAYAKGLTPMPTIQPHTGYQVHSGNIIVNGIPYSYYGTSYNPMQDFQTSMNNMGSQLQAMGREQELLISCLHSLGWYESTNNKTNQPKTENQIKNELEQFGKQLIAKRTNELNPSRSNPQYKQIGNKWFAGFIEIDPNFKTEIKNGSSKGTYVGIVRYQEKFMQCESNTKQTVLKGRCESIKTRNINELLRYDGNQWQD